MAPKFSPSTAPPNATLWRWESLYFVMVVAAMGRLIWMQWGVSHTDYQGDFTAYWLAGRALLHNANPYTYQLPAADRTPFYYTGFLYPPLVASFFTPLGRLDYYSAKLVWSALQLVCLASALGLTARLVWPRGPLAAWAALLLAAAVFPPVLLEFERGQIDCLTFLLVTGGTWAWVVRRNPILAAVLLVAAGIFKLPTLLLLLVPLAFKDKRFVKATAVCFAAVAVLSLTLNGPRLTARYWFHYLPTVAGVMHGVVITGNPPPASPTPLGVLPQSQGGPPNWPQVVWEGHVYTDRSTFPTRGSFASSYLSPVPERLRKLASVGGFLLAIVLITGCAWAYRRRPESEQPLAKQTLLAFAMVTVLVCHPLSWLMNYIWLLYAAPVLLLTAWEWRTPRPLLWSVAAGTLLCFTWVVPHVTGLLYKVLDQRFCLGSLLLYVSTAMILFHRLRGEGGPLRDAAMTEEHSVVFTQ